MSTTTSIACPLGCSGRGEVVSAGFSAVTATVKPCEPCTARGGTSWQVRASEVAQYLDTPVVLTHRDGLVAFR